MPSLRRDSLPLPGQREARDLVALYGGHGEPPPGCEVLSREEPGRYIAGAALVSAVRTAIALERPLLVTGEPGTGKTMLAWSVANELGMGKVLEFHTRSDHRAHDALYTYDHVLRFYHAQTAQEQAADSRRYVTFQALGRAIVEADDLHPLASRLRLRWRQMDGEREPDAQPRRRVVLIDEIDKAPSDFPNDLLDEIDRMEFRVHEVMGGGDLSPEPSPEQEQQLAFRARYRPLVIITSNSERRLPAPFLRRCVFHYIDFPNKDDLCRIVRERVPGDLTQPLLDAAHARFSELRRNGLEKPPSTDELIAWVRALQLTGVSSAAIAQSPLGQLAHLGALVKTEDDLKKILPEGAQR